MRKIQNIANKREKMNKFHVDLEKAIQNHLENTEY